MKKSILNLALILGITCTGLAVADRDDWHHGGYEGNGGYYGQHGHGGYNAGVVEGAIINGAMNGLVQSLVNPYGYRAPVVIQQPIYQQPMYQRAICVDGYGNQYYC